MNIAILGASGFIGTALVKNLVHDGHHVSALELNPVAAKKRLPDSVYILQWSLENHGQWENAVQQADVIINLAGAPLFGKRWTKKYEKVLRSSRIETTKALVNCLKEHHQPNATLINASACGYYGDTGGKEVDESSPAGHDFLAQLCVDWEAEARKASEFGVRVVCIRSAIVLGPGGGMLASLLPYFKAGLGMIFGSGMQHLPWIHLDDEVGIIKMAIANKNISGPMNAVAPNQVTYQEFAEALAQALHRPLVLRIPEVILRLLIGDGASALLTNQKIASAVAKQHGYTWNYQTFENAIKDIVKQ